MEDMVEVVLLGDLVAEVLLRAHATITRKYVTPTVERYTREVGRFQEYDTRGVYMLVVSTISDVSR